MKTVTMFDTFDVVVNDDGGTGMPRTFRIAQSGYGVSVRLLDAAKREVGEITMDFFNDTVQALVYQRPHDEAQRQFTFDESDASIQQET